jgi:protein gp37
MGKTSIEWADHTINPIRARNIETGAVGHFCEKIGPECAYCYASDWNERVRPSGKHLIGTGLSFLPVNRAKVETFLDRSKLEEVMRRRKPTRYFWCDMTDLFGEWVPDEMIDACFAVMALTPHHTHMVLTKRADRMREYVRGIDGSAERADDLNRAACAATEGLSERFCRSYALSIDTGLQRAGWPLPNVQLGVSAGNQPSADKQIPALLETPAAVRFLSAEPLLGPLDLSPYVKRGRTIHVSASVEGMIANRAFDDLTDDGKPLSRAEGEAALRAMLAKGVKLISCNSSECIGFSDQTGCPGHAHTRLDLVIDGGETGSRLTHPDWFRSLRDQCRAAGISYFHKQNGDWVPFYDRDVDDPDWRNVPKYTAKVKRLNLAGGQGFHGDRVVYFRRRKDSDGRELDGCEHNDLPAVVRG